ncbi:NADH-ubiquinone oxidoreductase subunit NDUFA12 family protein [Wolbachia endosymbiont of Pentidionis agamae]|uniref:NADH-ubiquinone oxidoreductase subunit NDUFA12 family protein n=1 Tax=Wolbachia endosymbiont of Pentidionis agamae TaxID=3110435 RepID=UPI002FD5B1EE
MISGIIAKYFKKPILAGKDRNGNKYYYNLNKRWVVYNGIPDPKKILPEWHAWIHYADDEIPCQKSR